MLAGRQDRGLSSLVRVTQVFRIFSFFKVAVGLQVSLSDVGVVFSCDDPEDLIDSDDIVEIGRDSVCLLRPDTLQVVRLPAVLWNETSSTSRN